MFAHRETMGPMAAESPARSTAMTSVWWDIQSCPVPVGRDPGAVVGNICAGLDGAGYRGPVSFFVFGDAQTTPRPVANALKSSGVVIRHVPAGNKDRCDKKILVEMLIWAFDNPAPANFLLITGDDELSNVLQSLRLRNYDTLLVQPRYTSQPCNSAQHCMWLWESLVSGGPASLPDGTAVGFEGGVKSRRCAISMQNENRKRQSDRGGDLQMCNSRKRIKPALNLSKRLNENETNHDKDRANSIQGIDRKIDQDRHQLKLMHEIDFERNEDKHAVKLVQEINLKNNGKTSMGYEMVQDMDISDEDEVEQKNDVKQEDGCRYLQDGTQQVDEKEQKYKIELAMTQDERKLARSSEKVKGELEKGELKGVNEPPGQLEDLIRYKNVSLHMGNEVWKTELVQSDMGGKVRSCQTNATRRRLRRERQRALNLIKRKQENETNRDKDRAKLNVEINFKLDQDEHQVKQTMLEMEQKDESLEKVKGEFEEEDLMIESNEPGRAEGLMKYENGLLHIEDEVSKELVQNITDCLNNLKQSVDGKVFEKQMNTVKDELKFIDELEKIEDEMEPKKDPSEIARESQVVDQEDKVAQIHVEQNRDEVQMNNKGKTVGTVEPKKDPSEIARESQVVDQEDKVAQIHVEQTIDEVQMDNKGKTVRTVEPKKDPSEIARESQAVDQEDKVAQIHVEQTRDEVQMDNKGKTVGTVQEKKKKKKNKRGKVETVMKMDERTPQTNEITQNFINNQSVIPGYHWFVDNTPQCAICGFKHLGICPWASVPCRSCGNLGHSPNFCPVNIYRGYLNIFSRRLGFGRL